MNIFCVKHFVTKIKTAIVALCEEQVYKQEFKFVVSAQLRHTKKVLKDGFRIALLSPFLDVSAAIERYLYLSNYTLTAAFSFHSCKTLV